jgi:hypothetical protein
LPISPLIMATPAIIRSSAIGMAMELTLSASIGMGVSIYAIPTRLALPR